MMQNANKVHKMTLTAVLVAIILVMSLTPLGYLRVGPVAITFLTIPVVIGAILLGPWYGGFLGAVFGATSFATCFGADPMGVALLSINPAATFFTCMVPRILIGVVTGLLFRALCRSRCNNALALILTTLVGCLTNTVLFVGAVIAFFQSSYFGGASLGSIIVMFFTANAVLEVIVCGLVSAGCSKALSHVMLRTMAL